MSSTTDITIVGGGIMGMLCARELVLAGASVAIIDQGQSGQEASWASGGILLPLYPWRQHPAISQLTIASLKLYPDLVKTLLTATDINPEWNPCGLFITENPDLDTAINWCHQHQLGYSTTPPVTTKSLKGMRKNPLWLPEIAQIRSPRLLRSLKLFLLSHRVRFIDNCQLLKLNIKAQRIKSITTTAAEIVTEQLILTTGAWTGKTWASLFPDGKTCVDVQPVKGQMLLIAAKPGVLKHIILAQDRYLIPRLDGSIVVGSTIEHCGFNKQTTSLAGMQLQTFAHDLLPELMTFPVTHHWAGLRPGTNHGIPYIDKHPLLDNFSVCAGHYRNGLTMGPASARLLVDLICNRPTIVPALAYKLGANH